MELYSLGAAFGLTKKGKKDDEKEEKNLKKVSNEDEEEEEGEGEGDNDDVDSEGDDNEEDGSEYED